MSEKFLEMKKSLQVLVSGLLVLFFLSTPKNVIAQQKISSYTGGKAMVFTNPKYQPREFQKVRLILNMEDIDIRWESAILEDFAKAGINAVGQSEIMDYQGEYVNEELITDCEKNGVDGIFTVEFSDAEWTEGTSYTPVPGGWLKLTARQQKAFVHITIFDIALAENALVIDGKSRIGGVYD